MTTFFPMMACGPSFGPEILLFFIPWLAGIVAGLINLFVICWRMSEPPAGFRNLAFFLGYAGLAVAFIRGVFGSLNSGMTMALFFGIPALPVMHSVCLFYSWRKDRKAKQR